MLFGWKSRLIMQVYDHVTNERETKSVDKLNALFDGKYKILVTVVRQRKTPERLIFQRSGVVSPAGFEPTTF